MRYELKSIGIWSFTKVAFFFNLVAGFIFGLVYALFLGVFLTLAAQMDLPVNIEELGDISFGFLVLFLPIISAMGGAVFCTLFGIVLLVIYNLIARALGGLEFDFKLVNESPASAPLVGQTSFQQPVQMRPVVPTPPPAPYASHPPVQPDPPPPGLTSPNDRRSTDTE